MPHVDQHLHPPPSLLVRLLPYLVPKPWTGKLWLDVIYLLAVAAVAQALLMSGPLATLHIDVLTPWLVTGFVLQSLPRATVLAVIGGLALELHSTAPAGMYICVYWVTAATIALVRNTLSWRHSVPWLVTMLAATAWLSVFEGFVASLTRGSGVIDLVYCLQQLTRIASAAGIGMICYGWWRSLESLEGDLDGEERPEP